MEKISFVFNWQEKQEFYLTKVKVILRILKSYGGGLDKRKKLGQNA